MADYYPLLAKAVAGLPNATPETRHAIYERARKALFGQLRNLDPPVPEEAIEREAQALEVAVAQLETELASPSAAGSALPVDEPDLRDLEPAAKSPAGVAPANPLSAPPPDCPSVDPKAPGSVPCAPDSGAWAGCDAFAETSRAEFPPLERPTGEAPAYDTSSPGPARFEPAVGMRLEAHRPFALAPERVAADPKRLLAVGGIVGLVVLSVAIAAYKLRDRPEDLLRPQSPSSAAQGDAIAGGKIVERVGAGTTTREAAAASGGIPSTEADRGGNAAKSAPSALNAAIPVAHQAALLVEAPEEQTKVKVFRGTAVWRIENVSSGPDEPLRTAVHAEIDIPEEKLRSTMTIQKNFDHTLPASHTVKLLFAVSPDSPLGNIKGVTALQMRLKDTPTGQALKGVTVPIMENSYLIGLTQGDAEASNLDLLRSREWLDVPMVLANGRIAKLTFEKGLSGQRALDDAMASWQAQ